MHPSSWRVVQSTARLPRQRARRFLSQQVKVPQGANAPSAVSEDLVGKARAARGRFDSPTRVQADGTRNMHSRVCGLFLH